MDRLTTIYLSFIFGFSNVYHSAYVWPTALKLGCVTNFDMLLFISLIYEIQFMLISSCHTCIRSISIILFQCFATYMSCGRPKQCPNHRHAGIGTKTCR